MAAPPPAKTRSFALAKTITKFLAAWSLLSFFAHHDSRLYGVSAFTHDAIARVFAGFPAAAWYLDLEVFKLAEILGLAFAVTLFFGTTLAVLGGVVRMLARSLVRSGGTDFLNRPREWTRAHSNAARVLLALPAVTWALFLAWPGRWEASHLTEWLGALTRSALPLALGAWGISAMTRKGLRELLAPTIDGLETKTNFAIGPDEIVFDAVAVTRRTLGLVGAFIAVMVLFPLLIAKLPVLELFRHGALGLYLFAGYAAFAAAGASAFRWASRVAVGLDGLHVGGTARAQFFAYKDIEAVRRNGADLELVRRGKVALRLQFHGEDAARRDAVLARITENIVRASEGRGAVAAQLVASSSAQDLARLADGAGSYRAATVSREELWGLIEGPEIDADARKAAAEALVRSNASEDRARLRVAAERCAEPDLRVALEELAAREEPLLHLPAARR
jgi:hypothetical protein